MQDVGENRPGRVKARAVAGLAPWNVSEIIQWNACHLDFWSLSGLFKFGRDMCKLICPRPAVSSRTVIDYSRLIDTARRRYLWE